ncbi:MAG: hypothetical protein H7X97_01635 [Opitutaceae bacterium]|nr:hypothetical protein [Verrucomicrobiales bacterium]
MKKFATFCFAIALLGVATPAISRAADGEGEKKKRPELTEEQKKVQKEFLEKYDTDKNGRLNAEERGKFSVEDKAKYEKAFPNAGKKKEKKKDA